MESDNYQITKLSNHQIKFIDLGLIDYKEAWDYQEKLFREVINKKLANRNLPSGEQEFTGNYLIFCEHPNVFTMGKSGSETNLLINEEQLKKRNIAYYRINRGGDITYHGPGQIVVYPIFNLDYFFTDIHKYMRTLEEAVILTLSEYGIKGERLKGSTGVWLDAESGPEGKQVSFRARKICAMGVRTSHWVTMHGIAFNVNPDLNYFSLIIPCGITDKAVTSMAKELQTIPNMEKVKTRLKNHLAEVFEIEQMI